MAEIQKRDLDAESALGRLVMQYARNCDRRDESGFGSLFTEQAALEGETFRFATPAEIRNVPNLLRRFAKTYHTVLNLSVEVDGNQGRGEAYTMAHHLTPRADGKYDDLVMYITYRDRYVRRGADWLIDHRRVVMEFTEQRIVENVGSLPTPS